MGSWITPPQCLPLWAHCCPHEGIQALALRPLAQYVAGFSLQALFASGPHLAPQCPCAVCVSFAGRECWAKQLPLSIPQAEGVRVPTSLSLE